MTILTPDRSRFVSIDLLENPYYGDPAAEHGDRSKPRPTDGTTTCYRYCTAYVVANGTPVTLVLTYGRNDEQEADDHITPSGHRVVRKYSRQSAVSGRQTSLTRSLLTISRTEPIRLLLGNVFTSTDER